MDSPDIDIDAVLASYIPLSQLPTPPPSYEKVKSRIPEAGNTTRLPNPRLDTSLRLDTEDYLSKLLPSNALHLITPSSSLAISTYLERADLPDPIIGLTACILESLSNRFVRSWRQAAFYAHVRSTRAETVVVAALSVATAFLDDKARSTRWWSEQVTEDEIRVKDINITARCILVDIDYDIHSFTAEMIADAVAEMKGAQCGKPTVLITEPSSPATESEPTSSLISTKEEEDEKDNRRDSGYGGGEAVWSHGVITPEPSPPLEVDVPFLRLL